MAITGNDFSAAFASFRLRQELTWCNGCRAARGTQRECGTFRVRQTPRWAAGERTLGKLCPRLRTKTDDNNLMSSTGFLVEMRYNDLISTSCKNEK